MGKKGPLWWRESDWLLRGSSAANQILLRHSGPILSIGPLWKKTVSDIGPLWKKTVWDPGFPRRGGGNPWLWWKKLLFDNIFAKHCMKIKEIGPRWGASTWRPHGSEDGRYKVGRRKQGGPRGSEKGLSFLSVHYFFSFSFSFLFCIK